MNLRESIKKILNESKTSQHLKLMNNLLDPFKEEDCLCDIKVSFDVEENNYDVYLVFSQKELRYKFSDLNGLRAWVLEMKNDVIKDLEAFLRIWNIFIGYYTIPHCGWSPLNESEDNEEKKIQKNLRAIKELINLVDYSEVCDIWVEYDPEDGYYAIRSKMSTKNHNTKALEKEFRFLEDSIKSLGLKAYISHPYWVEECEDKNELNESKQERKFTKLLNNIEEYLNSNSYNSVVRFMVDYDEVMDDVIVNIFIDAEDAVKLGGGINSVIKKTGKKIMEDLSVFPFDFKYHIHFERPQLNESETKTNSSLHRLLNMLFDGFDDIYYDWANYGCGMGVCCDPFAIGFTLPNKDYDDYIFKLVDGEMYNNNGDYPKELSDDLPEPCYQQPDIKDPRFDTIVFYWGYAEEIEDYMGPERNWKLDLLKIINKQFGCDAKRIVII